MASDPRLAPGGLIEEPPVAVLRLGPEAGLFPLGSSDQPLGTVRVAA